MRLIVNNDFGKKGNLYSLYKAKDYLANTYICCADHYFSYNPFIDDNRDNLSYRACTYIKGKFREFAVECSDANVITAVTIGGQNSYIFVPNRKIFPSYIQQQYKYH